MMIPPRPMIGVFPTYYVCFAIRIPEGLVGICGEIRRVGGVSDGPLKVVTCNGLAVSRADLQISIGDCWV
jgi:hypothetical protein